MKKLLQFVEVFRKFSPIAAILIPFLSMFTAPPLIAQMTAPPAEWNFDSPSIVSGFENDDNWAYTPIQASDGSIVAVGFSDRYSTAAGCNPYPAPYVSGCTTGERHPSIIKYIPGPVRKIQWETIPTFPANAEPGITIENSGGTGGFVDVFEADEGGIKYLYACGIIKKVGSIYRIPVIAKFDLITGTRIYFKEITGFTNARFTRMAPVYSGTTLSSIYIAGESSVSGGTSYATIFKLTPNGTLDPTFDADGWRQYAAPAPNNTKATTFKDIAFAANVSSLGDGFIAVGSIDALPNRDVFMVRLRSDNGNLPTGTNWPRIFSESSLGALYTDLNSPEPVICSGFNPENNNEEGFSIKRMPDGNFAVVCRFDFIEVYNPGSTPGCNPFNTEQYYDNDVAVVKINQSTGAPLYALDAGRSAAIDAWNVIAVAPNCGEMYISANAFNQIPGDPNGGEILGSVIRVDDQSGSFVKRWRKDMLGKHWQLCTFGICMTSDGGVVICGNNGKNGDDYEFIKFSSDRQANFTFNQSTTNITSAVTWNTPKTVKGVITVKSGGTLTIENTTAQFANTYTTNDWRTLSQGGGTPTKIVVEPNGKLILKNSTLKGLATNQCVSGTQEWMWEGVTVLGNPAQNPGTGFQGFVEMSLDAKIQNAYVGIHNGSTNYNSDGRMNSTGNDGGGIVKCQNPLGSIQPHFLNCRRSVWYAPVSNTITPPWSYLNTNFVCDQPMVDINFVDPTGKGRLGMSNMVSSWNRDGLTFDKCKFQNTLPSTLPETERGVGGDNFDARMTFTGCTFQQLYKGIRAQYGVGVTDPTTLTNCTFTQVRHGGHMVGGAFHTATGNTFQQIPANISGDVSYGLRFEGSTNLTVSESNIFSSTSVGTYGIVVKDSYSNASEFARNTFTNVDFGVQTEQINPGLQIRCNTHAGNDRAWSINPASLPNATGLFSDQGVCGTGSNQAGNLFNDPDCPSPGVPQSHIQSKVNFLYNARSGGSYNANEIPTCVSNGPTGTNGIVNVIFCGFNSNINACAPPCTNCSAAQSMMATAEAETDPWQKNNLYNKAFGLYMQEGNAQNALELVKTRFKDDQLYLGILLQEGKYNAIQGRLNALSAGADNKGLTDFYQVMIGLGKSKRTVMDLDASEENTLLEVAKGTSPSKYAAQNILSFARGYQFDRPVEIWENKGGKPDGADDRSEKKENLASSAKQEIRLAPNPANGAVEVRWMPSDGNGTLELIGMDGRLLESNTIALSGGAKTMVLEHKAAGVYIVRLRTASGIATQKLVIE